MGREIETEAVLEAATVGMRGTSRLAQLGGDGADMRVAASTWQIGGVVGAGVCEAVWWWKRREAR
jgi:hypothetical protein